MHKSLKVGLALATAFGFTALLASRAQTAKVSITYWQYAFDSKVKIMNTIMADFNKANPDIEVKQENFPYDGYIQKVESSLAAGQGPDVVNLFYGWVPQFAGNGLIQLPEADFPAKSLEANVGPLMKASKINNKYWAVPTAVRTLAVFYNKDLFKAAGIGKLPKTWAELSSAAQKIQKTDAGKIQIAGLALAPQGQDHHLFREVLVRQWGGKPYTADFKKITYNSEAGLEAWKFYLGLVSSGAAARGLDLFPASTNAYRDAFIAGRAGMIVDGSFAIGSIRNGAKFNWGVFELPVKQAGGLRSNFGSYWVHGLTRNATGAKLAAGVKFLKYLTSEKVQRDWLLGVGEIPANTKLASDAALRKDPVFGPFVATLPFAHATFFANEADQRKAVWDAADSVWLTKADPAKTLAQAAATEQKVYDDYFATLKK
jgi:multiple sugar transport system substrate-binding protein